MSQKDFWIQVLDRLQPTIKKAYFITWFQNTLCDVDGELLRVLVPTPYAASWLSDKYGTKILQAAQEISAEIKKVEYEVLGELAEKENEVGVNVKKLFSEKNEKKVRKVRNQEEVTIAVDGEKVVSKILNDRYSLKNFIVGTENQLPHAAAMAVSKAPGGIYNPLYIYGKVGLGKTHLLQATGREILKNFPDKVVKYVTAERFVSEVVYAISKRQMARFKEKYRNVDVFLIDDIQFFARKDSSQQEFFHTFNELYQANKQIILTSDRSPSELDDLDDRLTSRFGMGMVVELIFPDFETRVAILQEKCQEYQFIVDPDILSFIANNIHNSVRELEGVLKQMMVERQLSGAEPSIDSVARIIKRMNRAQDIIGYDIEQKQKAYARAMDQMDIINAVANYYKISSEQLLGKNRKKEIMEARQVCMYLIKKELNYSYGKIGGGFGGRNHTTVLHACNKTENRLRSDLRLVRDMNAIRQFLNN